MFATVSENINIDTLTQEHSRFLEKYTALQTELFAASEAFNELPTSKNHLHRQGSKIFFTSSKLVCDMEDGLPPFPISPSF